METRRRPGQRDLRHDQLVGVLRLGRRVASEFSPNAAWVTTLYERLLGREPDSQGLQFWAGNLDSHAMSREQVVLGFVRSSENFRNLTTAFLQQYLNRAPAAAN